MDGMVTEGWLTPAERAKAQFPSKSLVTYKPNRNTAGPNGFITDAVKRELKAKLKLTDADIDRGGYRIVTTIDQRAQKAALAAVKERMPTGKGTSTLRVGLTSIKPGDGAVVAMYGGKDYQKEQFNTATQATMQAGSTFKVFTLLAALSQDKPISTKTKFDGRSPQYFKEFEDKGAKTDFLRRGGVRNFGPGAGEQFGNIDLRRATGHSVNTVYAQLNIKVGPKATRDAAVTAGLPSKGLGTNYANVLGTSHVTVSDMANAYATIASQGTRVTPYFIRTVKGGPGDLNYKAKPAKKAAFDKDVTADATDAMQQVVKDGTAVYAQTLGRPVAGKTGTTTDNKAAWFDGFTPQLATAVGIYSTGKNGEELSMNQVNGVGELTGATVPLHIWTDFMTAALQGQKVVDFPKRAGLGDDNVYTPPPPPPSSTSTTSTSTTTTTTTPTTTTTTTPTPTKTNGTGKPTPSTTGPLPTTVTLGAAGPSPTSQ
jgi:membrane peptidoglycan carboxypeptidase